MSNKDDFVGSLIAAGVVVAVGYGSYRVLKAIGDLPTGQLATADIVIHNAGRRGDLESDELSEKALGVTQNRP